MKDDKAAAVPEVCGTCGGPLVFKEPWWEAPAAVPRWGYLVHCAGRHFAWYPAVLTDEEKAAAVRRFKADGGAGSAD